MVAHLTAILFVYHQAEDGRMACRNMVVNIQIKVHHKIKVHLLVVYAVYISPCSSLVLVTCRVLCHCVYQPTASLSYTIVIRVTAYFWNTPSMPRGHSSSATIKQLDSSKPAVLLYWLHQSSHPFPQSLVVTWGRLFTILIDLGAMSYTAVNTF